MNETCGTCKGLGEYVGLNKVVPCETCGGTGVRDATYPRFKSTILDPPTQAFSKGVLTTEVNQAVSLHLSKTCGGTGVQEAISPTHYECWNCKEKNVTEDCENCGGVCRLVDENGEESCGSEKASMDPCSTPAAVVTEEQFTRMAEVATKLRKLNLIP